HVADGVDVVRTLLADPHGGSLPLACWRPSWDRGGERRVMPADESKTAAPRRGAAAAMRDAALVSVAEVTHAGEHHGDAVLVGRGDHLGVAHRAARLDHRLDAGGGGGVNAVAEREERRSE